MTLDPQLSTEMDCRVVVEAAVPVYDVETEDEAIRIAIAKTGEMLNPDLNYVEIEMGERTSPGGEELVPAFIAADEALVALELQMTVFNVERTEHAARIARKEIGQRLEQVPLKILRTDPIEDGDDADADADAEAEADTDADAGVGTDESSSAATADGESESGAGSGDDLIPEFEELVDE
jgi:uncharacterized protein (UPF0212 family)